MSNKKAEAEEESAGGSPAQAITAYPGRETQLGDLPISRCLPNRERRMVGPWCFLDRFGPLSFGNEKPMQVPPHPHIGLQTVSWLIEGEVLHTDSLGSEAIVSPGGVNVMTAGRGIAHAEETPSPNSGRLNGAQLWVALPDEHRHINPSFINVAQVPKTEEPEGLIQLFAGNYNKFPSPAPHFSEIIGLDGQVYPNKALSLTLNPKFEHALLLLEGTASLENQPLSQKTLYFLGTARESLEVNSPSGGRFLLIGGPPFPEKILIWWNFVARTPEEIQQARTDWEAHQHFGDVLGTQLQRLSAPELGRIAQPNPVS